MPVSDISTINFNKLESEWLNIVYSEGSTREEISGVFAEIFSELKTEIEMLYDVVDLSHRIDFSDYLKTQLVRDNMEKISVFFEIINFNLDLLKDLIILDKKFDAISKTGDIKEYLDKIRSNKEECEDILNELVLSFDNEYKIIG